MATQSSYTTVKVSRFGFSVLSVTFDKVNTDEIKNTVCELIANVTRADEFDETLIRTRWDESLNVRDRFISFNVEDGGDHDNDYHVSIKHFYITEQQRINAVRADEDVSPMFL